MLVGLVIGFNALLMCGYSFEAPGKGEWMTLGSSACVELQQTPQNILVRLVLLSSVNVYNGRGSSYVWVARTT